MQVVYVEGAGKGVFSEIRKSQQSREGHAPHTAAESPFLSVESVRPHPFVAEKMKGFVFVGVVGFLKDRHIVGATLMEICVFVGVDGVDFQSHHAEVFPRQFAGFANVLYVAFGPAFTGENQDFLHAAVGDDLHFMLDLFHIQFHALDLVIAVETAVNAVVFAVVGNVEGREKINGVAEVLACFQPRLLCHFFQKRFGGGGEQRFEILNGTGGVLQGGFYILRRVSAVIVVIHPGNDVFTDIGINLFHSRQVFHVIFSAGRIGFQAVFLFQCLGRELFRIDKKLIFHLFHLLIP